MVTHNHSNILMSLKLVYSSSDSWSYPFTLY